MFLTKRIHSLFVYTVPPSIIDNMTSTDMVVREGSDVTLVCRAWGYPEPYVMWRREDGQDFNYNGESGKTNVHHQTDSTLPIVNPISRILTKFIKYSRITTDRL